VWLFLEPLDVVLFRDSKPFTAGESFWARSAFPPSPLPFMGALRAKLLVERGVDPEVYRRAVTGRSGELLGLIDQIGGPHDYGRLRLTGPFLAQKMGSGLVPYFPAPLDLRVLEGEPAGFLRPRPFPWPLTWNPPTLTPLWTTEAGDEAKGKMMDARNLKTYLEGGPGMPTDSRELWEGEIRVGIELSGRRTAEEGKLYTLEFIRLNSRPTAPLGFLLKVTGLEGLALPERGLLALGGESRGAGYEVVPEEALAEDFRDLIRGEALKERLEGQRRFKLYLATPGLFRRGWVPDCLQEQNGQYVGQIDSLRIRLVAAAVSKAVAVGGWDLVHNRPRLLRRAVPAGSVYFLEVDGPLGEADVQRLLDAFHFQSLSSAEDGQAGFGLALLGVCLEGDRV
jgi:CRISPR-associated protein Cmr3